MHDFTYVGFEPTQEIKTLGKQTFWQIEEKAPTFSCKKATMSRLPTNAYKGEFHVCTMSGEFIADAEGDAPEQVIEALNQKMRNLLIEWKKTTK